MKRLLFAISLLFCLPLAAQQLVDSQFLYDTASFPSCHAATIEALPNGDLVAAFFGGSWEGANDVCIWLCRTKNGFLSTTYSHDGDMLHIVYTWNRRKIKHVKVQYK